MSSVTNNSQSTGCESHGSSLSMGSGNLEVMNRASSFVVVPNFQRSFSSQLKREAADKTRSLKVLAAKVNEINEMTLEWFSCASPTSELARAAASFTRSSSPTFGSTETEGGGIEIDEGSSLRTAYQLERV
jgi:hypothetical protein